MSDFTFSHEVTHSDTLLLDKSVVHTHHKHKDVKVDHYLKGTSSLEKISFDGDTLYLTSKKGYERKVSDRKGLNKRPSCRDLVRRIIEDITLHVLNPTLINLDHLVNELGNSHRDQVRDECERRSHLSLFLRNKNIAPKIYQQALGVLEMLNEFPYVGYWDDAEDDRSGEFLERSSKWSSEFILLDGKVFRMLVILKNILKVNQERDDRLTREFLHRVFRLISELLQYLKERATSRSARYLDRSSTFEEPLKTVLYILHLLKDDEKESKED